MDIMLYTEFFMFFLGFMVSAGLYEALVYNCYLQQILEFQCFKAPGFGAWNQIIWFLTRRSRASASLFARIEATRAWSHGYDGLGDGAQVLVWSWCFMISSCCLMVFWIYLCWNLGCFIVFGGSTMSHDLPFFPNCEETVFPNLRALFEELSCMAGGVFPSCSEERKVGRVDLPFWALERLNYSPFQQQIQPFPS